MGFYIWSIKLQLFIKYLNGLYRRLKVNSTPPSAKLLVERERPCFGVLVVRLFQNSDRNASESFAEEEEEGEEEDDEEEEEEEENE
jgi:hypothetical protein